MKDKDDANAIIYEDDEDNEESQKKIGNKSEHMASIREL